MAEQSRAAADLTTATRNVATQMIAHHTREQGAVGGDRVAGEGSRRSAASRHARPCRACATPRRSIAAARRDARVARSDTPDVVIVETRRGRSGSSRPTRARRAIVGCVDGGGDGHSGSRRACGQPIAHAVSRTRRTRAARAAAPRRRRRRRRSARAGVSQVLPSVPAARPGVALRAHAPARHHRAACTIGDGIAGVSSRSKTSPRGSIASARSRRISTATTKRSACAPQRALAAGRRSPLLLADALADESWRVRRVAAEGHGRERRPRSDRRRSSKRCAIITAIRRCSTPR